MIQSLKMSIQLGHNNPVGAKIRKRKSLQWPQNRQNNILMPAQSNKESKCDRAEHEQLFRQKVIEFPQNILQVCGNQVEGITTMDRQDRIQRIESMHVEQIREQNQNIRKKIRNTDKKIEEINEKIGQYEKKYEKLKNGEIKKLMHRASELKGSERNSVMSNILENSQQGQKQSKSNLSQVKLDIHNLDFSGIQRIAQQKILNASNLPKSSPQQPL